MTDVEISNAAKDFLNSIYQEYMDKLKNGESLKQAMCFYNNIERKCKASSSMPKEDVDVILDELIQIHFARRINIIGDFELTTNAITYMENRFKRKAKGLFDIFSKFIP